MGTSCLFVGLAYALSSDIGGQVRLINTSNLSTIRSVPVPQAPTALCLFPLPQGVLSYGIYTFFSNVHVVYGQTISVKIDIL